MPITTRRRAGLRAVAVGLVALLAAGCGGDDDDEGGVSSGSVTSPASSSASTAPSSSGSSVETTAGSSAPSTTDAMSESEIDPSVPVKMAVAFASSTWDPATVLNSSIFNTFTRSVYERLVSFVETPDGEQPAPGLADSWTISPDGLTVEFKLRSGVTFHDGTPFNADAVKGNFDRAKTLPNSTGTKAFELVESIDVVDDLTVRLNLSAPDTDLLYVLGEDPAGAIASPAGFDGTLETQPIGTGPYRVVDIKPDVVTFEKYDGYWDPNVGGADMVTIATIPDANARINAVQDGLVDIILTSPLDYEVAQDIADGGDYQFEMSFGPDYYLVGFNTARPPFDNVDVRRAVSLAIDREAMSEGVLPFNPPTQQMYQQGAVGHVPDLDEDIPVDVAEATALLAAAGAAGATVTAVHPANDHWPTMAQVVQAQLAAIGLNVELTAVPPAEFTGRWRSGDFDMQIGQQLGSTSPERQAILHLVTANIGGQGAEEALELVAAASKLDQSSSEAATAWREISEYLVEKPIEVPVVRSGLGFLAADDIVGLSDLAPQKRSLYLQAVGHRAS